MALNIRPADRLIKNYYESLHQFGQLEFDHEGAVRSAFQAVLDGYGKRLEWKLVPEYPYKKVRVDGALLDTWKQRRGFWEAKDIHDDLEREIRAKIEKGYPTTNIIFQAPERAILYQRGIRVGLNENIGEPKNLVELLQEFFSYQEPEHEEWDKAVEDFSKRLPEIAQRAKELIDHERQSNKAFRERFEEFYALCRRSINPNLSFEAVEEMLIQHLLTERIFRRVFHAEEFRTRNVIAQEIEKVISSLTSRHFSRDAFLSELDRFYKAIERSAEEKSDYTEKQDFLNTVYERFFQGYSPKEADTHGIVYTPQPIVDFMVRSVEDILKKEFGKSLSDKGVHILDPFVGTGNFIVRIMREMKKTALPYKYENELHCNEVMLLPYYIASMNIEHEYFERTGEYRSFPGICLVDTFDLAEPDQQGFSFMTEENTARVKRQKESPIFVVIGNPPYNMQQVNENDQNRNRTYEVIDERVRETYTSASSAALRSKLSDPYVKAFRFATDRIADDGIVCFVSNDGFIDQVAFDGMRKYLNEEFTQLYVLDLGGNVRKNPRISGTTHNVFGIKVGVAITILVKNSRRSRENRIAYASVPEEWRRQRKYDYLEGVEGVEGVKWKYIVPDNRSTWLTTGERTDFEKGIAIGDKNTKDLESVDAIFRLFSLGLATNRDTWVYSFSEASLQRNVKKTIDAYADRMGKLRRSRTDTFDTSEDDRFIKWTDRLLEALRSGKEIALDPSRITLACYRPFSKRFIYFDSLLNQRRYQQHRMFPLRGTENVCVCINDIGSRTPLSPLAVNVLPDLHVASSDGFQCFPFYTYDEDGSNRRENITDWALNEFRTHYHDSKIGKWDIFDYVYGVLHSPEYRERYAANLKRELPRIPFAPDFWGFARAGARLAELHVNYEKQPEYPLQRIENPKEKLNLRVEKMRLGKDKTSLTYNSFLTLAGIPAETYEYRLGNRSALEWIVDQYQVSTDKRSGITNDPNRKDDKEYILRLIGQVIYVSLETVKIVKSLPELGT